MFLIQWGQMARTVGGKDIPWNELTRGIQKAGGILREDVIKLQHHTKTTRRRWRGHEYDFYKIAH
jgi:hypothetical protein